MSDYLTQKLAGKDGPNFHLVAVNPDPSLKVSKISINMIIKHTHLHINIWLLLVVIYQMDAVLLVVECL